MQYITGHTLQLSLKKEALNIQYHSPCLSDEECCILNELEESPHSVDALRSSYKQLHNMTNNDLEQRLNDYLPYFEEVIRGTIPNERHEVCF